MHVKSCPFFFPPCDWLSTSPGCTPPLVIRLLGWALNRISGRTWMNEWMNVRVRPETIKWKWTQQLDILPCACLFVSLVSRLLSEQAHQHVQDGEFFWKWWQQNKLACPPDPVSPAGGKKLNLEMQNLSPVSQHLLRSLVDKVLTEREKRNGAFTESVVHNIPPKDVALGFSWKRLIKRSWWFCVRCFCLDV